MIKAVVTDIEGTTSSISFVVDELFPFARRHLPNYLRENHQLAEVAEIIGEVGALIGDSSLEAVIEALCQWIDDDKKVTPLKTLQGMIWKQGYTAGELKGHLYEDAHQALAKWHAAGLHLYIYSSGSVGAQKLLFGHSKFGDLTPLFKGYFDTHIGHKQEAASYANILKSLDLPANEVLFLSDVKAELDAAAANGIHTYALDRQGPSQDFSPHPVATNFAQILTELP